MGCWFWSVGSDVGMSWEFCEKTLYDLDVFEDISNILF